MSPYERMRARLAGQMVDRPPNFDIMMQFAAHYIGQPLGRYYQDYRVLCSANYAVQEAFDLDILQAISDPYREAADCGTPVAFPDDGLPIWQGPRLREPEDLRTLRPPKPEEGRRMSDRLEAIRHFREQAGGRVPIMGWVEGALAEAADLRGVSTLLTDLYDRPEWVQELLEACTETAIAFARAQVTAGADIIGLGDAIASQVAPQAYRRFALPYEQRVFAAVREMGALPRLHICGNTTRLLADMAESGAAIIDIDWMVDMRAATEAFGDRATARGDRVAVCGNFDPVAAMLRGSPEQIIAAVTANMAAGGPRCFSMAGCEIPDGTPHANLRAHAAALRQWGGR